MRHAKQKNRKGTPMNLYKQTLALSNADTTARMFGPFDANMRLIERAFSVVIRNRGQSEDGEDTLLVEGEECAVRDACRALESMRALATQGDAVPEQSVRYIIRSVQEGDGEALADVGSLGDDCICVTTRGKPIRAKTLGQRRYVEAIRKNTITFGIGPAGTGKTFLAVAMAVKALRDKQVSRIILTRPAIEAGERLGFLPGDLQSKIDPYLRPLYDALFEMMGAENYAHCVEKQTIEVAPLAYMRGRTLDDSFIILDEAQNATQEQMKMFLTRLGFNAKAVITGDLTQTDLPHGTKSGLSLAVKILDHIEDIAIHRFTERDVVRHHLVQTIIQAYDRFEKEKFNEREKSGESYQARKWKK